MRALAAIFLIFNLAFCEANSTLSAAHTRLESNASSAASEKKDENSKLSALLTLILKIISVSLAFKISSDKKIYKSNPASSKRS